MHDQTLLQLIEEDIPYAGQLLELLQAEALALHGRDMGLLENILAQKQSLIVLLEQHGRRRSQLLVQMGLSPDRAGLQALAAQSHLGEQLLARGDMLTQLLADCQTVNAQVGQGILRQQVATANQIRILTGGDAPSLYDSRGSTARMLKPRALSQA
ncbi:flagella synthesis protein FlgN [Pseudomonas sp. UBA4194]|uniref:flagella synthesis protein FlgN n=1 Tax=Pseudomonas sp. UBA4194 TaxID=1947317 RepID=UPI0025ECEFE3|nr:flagellar protein FlgN [Pseudomonas sp. UBA4194]